MCSTKWNKLQVKNQRCCQFWQQWNYLCLTYHTWGYSTGTVKLLFITPKFWVKPPAQGSLLVLNKTLHVNITCYNIMLRHIQNNFNKDNSDAQKLQYRPVIRQTSTNQNIMLQNTTMIYYLKPSTWIMVNYTRYLHKYNSSDTNTGTMGFKTRNPSSVSACNLVPLLCPILL